MHDSSTRLPILFGLVCLMILSQLGCVIISNKAMVAPIAAFVMKRMQLQHSPPTNRMYLKNAGSAMKDLRTKKTSTLAVYFESSNETINTKPVTSKDNASPSTHISKRKVSRPNSIRKISTSSLHLVQEISSQSPKPSRRKTRLKPQQILDQYIEWHGQASLKRQPGGRDFVVGYYSCPSLAGNRMHDFFNTMVAAIATNKTLLYKFWDHETCNKVLTNPDIRPYFCNKAKSNTIEMCNALVERASWLPSYDEWAPKLNLSPLLERGINKDGVLVNGTLTQMPALVEISSVENMDDLGMFNSTSVTKEAAREMANELYSEGILFAFGMLFQEIFPLKHDQLNANLLNKDQHDDETISIALHSRHWTDSMDGTDVRQETNCLKRVMNDAKIRSGRACKVYIMSDREATLTGVSDFVKAQHCTPVVASHEKGEGIFSENGPFATGGFFQDLTIAQRARHGFVGNCGRSSSQLLREMIEYNRFVENLDDENYRRMDIPTCCLPDWDWVKANETKSSVAAYAI